MDLSLPPQFSDWFHTRGWALHPHQADLLRHASDKAALLIAPTGGGKTLAGFLPSLIELSATPHKGMHTLYVSPLKALTADIRRNLATPIADLHLDIRVEDRTGDTSGARKMLALAPPSLQVDLPPHGWSMK